MNATVNVPTHDHVSPANQAIFDTLKKQLGFVPNLYATFAHSAHALPAYLALQAAKSSLSAKEREVVNLAVSEVNGCEYCLAAHTVIAKKFGYSDAQILEMRGGGAGFDPRLDALARLVHDVALERGHADPARVQAPSSPPAGPRRTRSMPSWPWATRPSRTTCTGRRACRSTSRRPRRCSAERARRTRAEGRHRTAFASTAAEADARIVSEPGRRPRPKPPAAAPVALASPGARLGALRRGPKTRKPARGGLSEAGDQSRRRRSVSAGRDVHRDLEAVTQVGRLGLLPGHVSLLTRVGAGVCDVSSWNPVWRPARQPGRAAAMNLAS